MCLSLSLLPDSIICLASFWCSNKIEWWSIVGSDSNGLSFWQCTSASNGTPSSAKIFSSKIIAICRYLLKQFPQTRCLQRSFEGFSMIFAHHRLYPDWSRRGKVCNGLFSFLPEMFRWCRPKLSLQRLFTFSNGSNGGTPFGSLKTFPEIVAVLNGKSSFWLSKTFMDPSGRLNATKKCKFCKIGWLQLIVGRKVVG